MGARVKDILGNRYGKLIVKSRAPERIVGEPEWLCACDCGKSKVVIGQKLRRGHVKSCGCLITEDTKTHGLSESPEYNIWRHMKDRCLNPKNKNYQRYGGRGITVCSEWLDSFESFYRDLGPRPGEGLSIERIDNDKGYCKENCKWATKTEQANNRETSVFYEYNGVKRTLAAWCRELKLDYKLVNFRLNKYGWSFEQAIRPKLR